MRCQTGMGVLGKVYCDGPRSQRAQTYRPPICVHNSPEVEEWHACQENGLVEVLHRSCGMGRMLFANRSVAGERRDDPLFKASDLKAESRGISLRSEL